MIELSPKDILLQGKEEIFQFEEGERFSLELQPALTEAELASFEDRLGAPLPDEIRQLLAYTRGFEFGEFGDVSFTGEHSFEFKAIFPLGVPLLGDGAGNFWVVDVDPEMGNWMQVYFAAHEPPVLALQAHSLSEFLVHLLNAASGKQPNHLEHVPEKAAWKIWKDDPDALTAKEAMSGDKVMKAFVKQQTGNYLFYDMRKSSLGSGLRWGKDGADPHIVRHGRLPIFAVEQVKKKGFWDRIGL